MGSVHKQENPNFSMQSAELGATSSKSLLPFSTVLIANRGEIAIRLIRAAKSHGLRSVAVFTPEDSSSAHTSAADVAVGVGPGGYMNIAGLVRVAKETGSEAVLPGYGFLSEHAEAVQQFEEAGIKWIGPSADSIRKFGLKHEAREVAKEVGVGIVPGSAVLNGGVEEAVREARRIGYPVLIKASAGGGGMGQFVVRGEAAMRRVFQGVIDQAKSLFGNGDVYVERFVERARHVEVQVFGNGKKVLALGTRDCSVQRRRQKVIEEGGVGVGFIEGMKEAAVRLCEKVGYRSAGTVEFLVDASTKEWWFLEVNTRLQVEHGVTEMVTGIDIVSWMIMLAGGKDVLRDVEKVRQSGVAIEARVYAEIPIKDYVPCAGTLSEMIWPEEGEMRDGGRVRVDKWAQRGTVVPPHYDPLLGKVIAWGRTRPLAIIALLRALKKTVVRGVPSNTELLLQVMDHPDFLQGKYTTSLLGSFTPRTRSIEVIKPGLQSSLQDYPGRVGYWDIGVSPSGPMDAYAMGMANALVGNSIEACALEMTMAGPTLFFHTDAIVVVTGGRFHAELDDGKPVEYWIPFQVKAGSILSIGQVLGHDRTAEKGEVAHVTGGKIAYLAVRGGFDAPKYLGSSSTFPTGKFGGLTGSFLATGDFLPVGQSSMEDLDEVERNGLTFRWPLGKALPNEFIPKYDCDERVVGALNGPHASADFFQEETLQSIWTTLYEVHHATNRLGARLIGPAPKWTRPDGGSAGLHPSNLHDFTYAPGAVNFSGNTPIVLMLDGPSLGGFVCPITVATAELWKVAQAMPGEKIKFKQLNYDDASAAFINMEAAWEAVRAYDIESLSSIVTNWSPDWARKCPAKEIPAVLASLDPVKGDHAEIKVVYRMSGDEHVLIEYGDIELDLAYRLRVHMLMEELKSRPYIKELCPGVRSLLVRYSRVHIHVDKLVSVFIQLEKGVLGSVDGVQVPSRVINLPLAFEDKWTIEAQRRYLRSVRPDAPYMPSNVEFVRRINGLESVKQVKEIMISAEYMVLGLGDVYLGAPCAVPVDPRHRLVTSKYNPARTYTPEGAVGIGGAYMCIYGMDSPGGYQLTGRTLPIWDNYGSIPEKIRGAPKDVPWLLRFFDRVKFFPVTDDELEELRSNYRKGNYKIDIVDETFKYREYVGFVENNSKSIAAFEKRRDAAYAAERARWEAGGEGESNAAAEHAKSGPGPSNTAVNTAVSGKGTERPPFSVSVPAGMAASVWAVNISDGDTVEKGTHLFSLESMKVEIAVEAPLSGTVLGVSVVKGDSVSPDKELCYVVSSEDVASSDATIDQLHGLYKLGVVSPCQVALSSLKSAEQTTGIFAAINSDEVCQARALEIQKARDANQYAPLHGIPFVIADGVDAQGFNTNSAIPELTHEAHTSATVVHALEAAGAILIGKTVTDQLNIGNTGVEMSGTFAENPVHAGLVTGGNGAAAAAVQKKIASFAITIDRNGTSTVAPALCGVMGMKTTEGLLPVPDSPTTCPLIDCIGIYAKNAADIKRVLNVCISTRRAALTRPCHDFLSEELRPAFQAVKLAAFRFDDVKTVTESDEVAEIYEKAVDAIKRMGYETEERDISVFTKVSSLLDETPIQHTRLNELGETIRRLKTLILPSVSERVLAFDKISVSTLGTAMTALEKFKRQADVEIWSRVDAAILPVYSRALTVEEAAKDITAANQNLSKFCQFFTLMDLCAITLHIPASTPDKDPQGICVIAPPFHEELLLELGRRWEL